MTMISFITESDVKNLKDAKFDVFKMVKKRLSTTLQATV